MSPYRYSELEPKWQKFWEEEKCFAVEDPAASKKPKYYVLDMFPYPSAAGLHVGHVEGYTASDIVARYKRARGFNVLHPMGWDAFGLPAEQYALATGVHPAITTQKAIDNFRTQLKRLGLSYDWSREISTCDPAYYKWTQFIFKKLHSRGLAYQKEVPVNWCPALKTVLANEEVVDGKSERGGHPVERRPMRQWMLKITDYAERLLADLDGLDWPESTKELQRHWIGRSEGLTLRFALEKPMEGVSQTIEVYTTRADTLFGVSFLAVAPEHPLVDAWVARMSSGEKKAQIETYIQSSLRKSELSRQEQTKDKTGVDSGMRVVHPGTGKLIPVWIADYVMMGYGTGAVMGVPAHDERDHEFARAFGLPIQEVVAPLEQPQSISSKEEAASSTCFSGKGRCIHSEGPLGLNINGLQTHEAIAAVIAWAKEKGIGEAKVQYKLRDWLFSRQRYWGEPIPVVRRADGSGQIQCVSDEDLPVTLPQVESYEPTGTGESPLAAITSWVQYRQGKDETWVRETDTMPGSAGSSWYFLRFADPHNNEEPFSKKAEAYWLPVDLYLGGPEHAVGHLLYARFWMKVLFDLGLVSHSEPFQRLVHQGMILGEDGEKMSKSRGNVINPDHVIEKFGTDSLRLYEMFMGPLEKEKPWSTHAIDGVHRFLHRVWRLCWEEEVNSGVSGGPAERWVVAEQAPSPELERLLHKTIKGVTEAIETLRLNTAISQMMILVNEMTKGKERPRSVLKVFVQLLAPFAPHICEELWSQLGETILLTHGSWPVFDSNLAKDDTWTIAVQVQGKTRGTVDVAAEAAQTEIESLALALESVQRACGGKTPRKVIYVPRKLINFVV